MSASCRNWACGLLALALCALGCASATGYEPLSSAGGYEDTQLDPGFFRVSFEGNEYTTMARAQDFALLRASELTLANQFAHFAIVDESAETRVETVEVPASTETTETTTGRGRHKETTTTTTYVPPRTYYLSKPRSGLLIRCFPVKPSEPETFDAAFLQRTLREKYKLK